MKNKLIIILTALLLLSLICSARSQSGIYMSVADFRNNKLSYENPCKKSIHVHDFFWSKPAITVKSGNKKYTLKKSAVYGYRDCDNTVYRFYNNTEYNIAEAGSIFIYTKEQNIAQSKGYKVVNTWYFSTTADGVISLLTLANLKDACKSNDKFLDLIRNFSDSDLNAYDETHNTFKVNYLYSKTINVTSN